MVTGTGDVIASGEDVTVMTTKFSKLNGVNIADVRNNGVANAKNVNSNGPELTTTKHLESDSIGNNGPGVHNKSSAQTMTSVENTDFRNGKYVH